MVTHGTFWIDWGRKAVFIGTTREVGWLARPGFRVWKKSLVEKGLEIEKGLSADRYSFSEERG